MRALKASASLLTLAVAVSGAVTMAALGDLGPDPASLAATAPSGLQGKKFLRAAALGDSITLGINACGEAGECRKVSWSTGNDGETQGFAARIGEATGHQPDTGMLAGAGARARDLPTQAAAAASGGADLVTILIGGNDACAPTLADMTPTADYAASVKQALTALDASPQKPVVFIASVPYLNGLLTAHSGSSAARHLWEKNHVCQSLLANPSSSASADVQRRAAVAARVNEYNSALAEQCAAASKCVFDGGAVATIDFTAEQISDVDFFHPSRAGQLAIADAAWTALVDTLDHCELPPALRKDFGC
jgi:lysophospholipase L1-like esterase